MATTLTNARIFRNEIAVIPGLNSRKNMDLKRIDKLRDSIKSQGLIHPPLVVRAAQIGNPAEAEALPYILVAGFRRQMALDIIAEEKQISPDGQDGDYRLAPSDWTLADCLMANLSENLGREDLSSYELAAQCVELREKHQLGASDIAKRVKAMDAEAGDRKPLSEAHINNLMRCMTQLHPVILKAWEEQHPRASLRTLIALAAEKDQNLQLAEWQGVKTDGEADEDSDRGSGGDDKAEKPARRPTPANVAIMVERVKKLVKDGLRSKDWGKGATEALMWASGVKSSIPGIKDEEPISE